MTTRPAPVARPRLFYGWVVVASAFAVMFISFGTAYTFGAFFQPLQAEFDATRGDTALIFSLSGFLYFALGAVSGPLADRLGARAVVAVGMGVIGAGLLLASQAQSLWQLYLTYGLAVGLGVGLAYVPAIGAVQPWFQRKRGFASGLAVAGIGVGTLAMPPAAVILIDWLGWRQAYIALALFAGIVGIGFALLLDERPERRGLRPDGEAPGEAAGAAAAPQAASLPLRQALRTRPFWHLYLAGFGCSFGLFMPFVHLAAYAQDHGLSERTGVLLISLIGVGSVVGRFALGGIADRMGRRRALIGMFIGMALMLLWWLGSTGLWMLTLFALLFGTFYGGFVALIPALTADFYGGRNISSILGVLYTSVALGTLLGPSLAGFAYDVSGSYTVPILASAATCLVAIGSMLALTEPDRWRSSR